MVKTLLIENSTGVGTVAFAESTEILQGTEFSKSGMLSVAIHQLLREFGAPDEIVCGLGPGSYTGIRVAVATAIGLKIGLGCPVYGCSSVLAFEESTYHVVGDARFGSVFLASIEQNRLVRSPELRSVEEFGLLLKELGGGPIFAVGPVPGFDGLQIKQPRAEHLLSRRDWFQPSLDPIYLKEPHITQPRN
jgi:tRNA threonylcarbamoyl adenosine modification protein YeaZ